MTREIYSLYKFSLIDCPILLSNTFQLLICTLVLTAMLKIACRLSRKRRK